MNEHIKEYCEKFIESPESPHFALFIKGDWGTGKTYFIDKLIEKYTNDTNIKQNEIIKISLFGVKNTEDIDLKIYQKIHPVLSSNEMKVIGAVARTALKLGTNVDFNRDGKNDLSLTLGGLSLGKQKKIKKIQKKLIIVDDFERASMDACEIFGYFSEIIAESDTKVIFIGNEEKISEKDEDKKNEYLQIKEKTIGMEFKIEPVFDDAIKQFLIEIPFSEDSKEELKEIVTEITVKLNCENLRTIRQALYNLSFFINVIDSFEDNDKRKAIIIFLMLFIQKSLKLIDEDVNISKVINTYFDTGLSYKKYLEKNPNAEKSLTFSRFNDYTPLLNHWYSIIFNGNYQVQFLTEKYQEEKGEIKKAQEDTRKTLFRFIGNWRTLDKKTFPEMYQKINKELEEGVYLHLGEILHYANIMFVFSKWGLIPESVTTISDRVKKVLKNYNNSIIPEKDWGMLQIGYAGYGFSFDVPEFTELYKELKIYNQGNVAEKAKTNINEDIKLLESDISTFHKNIIHVNGNGKYYGQPILSYIDVEKFYSTLKGLPVEKQILTVECFEERYSKSYSNGTPMKEYRDDYQNLKKLAELYKNDDADFSYNPQAFFQHSVMNKWSELVSYFENSFPDLVVK